MATTIRYEHACRRCDATRIINRRDFPDPTALRKAQAERCPKCGHAMLLTGTRAVEVQNAVENEDNTDE